MCVCSCIDKEVLGSQLWDSKKISSLILELLKKAQDPCTVVSSLILEECKKGLACHSAGILRRRSLGCLVGKVGLRALEDAFDLRNL